MQAREPRPCAGPTGRWPGPPPAGGWGRPHPGPGHRPSDAVSPSGGPRGLLGRPALPRPLSVKWAQQGTSQPPALPAGQKASCPPPTHPREDALTALCFLLLSDSVRCPATGEVGEATARAPVRTARPLWCAGCGGRRDPRRSPRRSRPSWRRGAQLACAQQTLAGPWGPLASSGSAPSFWESFPLPSFLPSLPLHFPKVPTAPGGRLGPPS